MTWRTIAFVWMLSAVCGLVVLSAIVQQPTSEEQLQLQVVLLRGQLAEALKAQAKCEADGSQAQQQLQKAQTEGQALLKALEARGLMIDQTNTIVAKPAPEKKP
jgi:Skp family chaperone for outer membrane proteins